MVSLQRFHRPHHKLSNQRYELKRETLSRFATLLGTYSSNGCKHMISTKKCQDGKVPTEDIHTRCDGIETLLCASSCECLRSIFLDPGDSKDHNYSDTCRSDEALEEDFVSTFPSLLLHTSHSPVYRDEMKTISEVHSHASKELSYPLLFRAPRNTQDHFQMNDDCHHHHDSDNIVNTNDLTNNSNKRSINQNMNVKRKKARFKLNPPYPTDATIVSDIAKVPIIMLENFSSSFKTLLEARLRAYSTFLTNNNHYSVNQDKNDANMIESTDKEKLNMLVYLSENVEVKTAVISYRVKSQEYGVNISEIEKKIIDDEMKSNQGFNVMGLPLDFEAIIDLNVPYYRHNIWGNKVITTVMNTSGIILGHSVPCSEHDHFSSISINLDCDKLLSSMVNQACNVIRKVMLLANECLVIDQDQEKVLTGDPLHTRKKFTPDTNQSEITIGPSPEAHIVSPNLTSQSLLVPCPEFYSLDSGVDVLEDDDELMIADITSDTNESDLCASIVDYAIGEIDFQM